MVCILEKAYKIDDISDEALEWSNEHKRLKNIQITISLQPKFCIVGHIYEFYNTKEKEVKTFKTNDSFEEVKNNFLKMNFNILYEGE